MKTDDAADDNVAKALANTEKVADHIERYRVIVSHLLHWLTSRALDQPRAITLQDIEYQRENLRVRQDGRIIEPAEIYEVSEVSAVELPPGWEWDGYVACNDHTSVWYTEDGVTVSQAGPIDFIPPQIFIAVLSRAGLL